MSDKSHRHVARVRDFMSEPPHCISPHASLLFARDEMRSHSLHHLPVLDGGHVLGVVSDRDLEFTERYREEDPNDIPVSEAMAQLPWTVAPDTPLEDVVADMADNRYSSALVVDHGKLIGIFTTVDALRATRELCRRLHHQRE